MSRLTITIEDRAASPYSLKAEAPGQAPVELYIELDHQLFADAEELARSVPMTWSRRFWQRRVDPETLGTRLGRLLLPPPVEALCHRAQMDAHSIRGDVAEIRLQLVGLRADRPSRLHALPWEWARSEAGAVGQHGHLVRGIGEMGEEVDAASRGPLRVLMVMASPKELPSLQLRREMARVEAVWRSHPVVEVHCLRAATFEGLKSRLEYEVWHVVHFLGHGSSEGSGALVFEDSQGRPHKVTGEELAAVLRAERGSLRLVVLNACHSGSFLGAAQSEGSRGVAYDLVEGGMDAVVAMQYRISDDAALQFSKIFYHRLASGDTVSAALTEARRTLARSHADEWATPVLFQRHAEVRLCSSEDLPIPAAWKWNPLGAAALTAAALSVSLLTVSILFASSVQPALTDFWKLLGGSLALVAWVSRALWPAAVLQAMATSLGQRKGLSRLLLSAPVLIVAGWLIYLPPVVDARNCGALAAAPEVTQVIFEVGESDSEIEQVWGAETVILLRDILLSIPTWQPVDVSIKPELVEQCVELVVRVSVETQPTLRLRADLHHPDGPALPAIDLIGMNASQQEFQRLQVQLAQDLVDRKWQPGFVPRGPRLQLPPLEARSLNLAGTVALATGRLEDARVFFIEALKPDNSYAAAWNNLGQTLVREGELSSAMIPLASAYRLQPRHPIYAFNLGSLHLDLWLAGGTDEHREQAIHFLGEAIALDPAYVRARNNLGFVFLLDGRLDSAGRELRTAMSLVRHDEIEQRKALHKNLGRVYLEQNDVEAAERQLTDALALDAGYPEARYFLALARERLPERDSCGAWLAYQAVAERDVEEARRREGGQRAARCGAPTP